MNAPITLIQSTGELPAKRARLEAILATLESVLVAYSGGADSTLLLRVAHDVLGERAEGAIAVSASVPSDEISAAVALANVMGVMVHQVVTHEFEREKYLVNQPDRCYHCKVALFDELEPLAARQNLRHIVYGANRDDLGDFRPGQRAAERRGVRAPLVEAGFTKLDIRELSRQLGLPTWNKPAQACLSSRVPHGTRIEPEVLERIAAAERFLKELGVAQVRVRTYDTTARIEADAPSIERLAQPEVRDRVIRRLKELGYEFVTLDLEGFRSGSLNPPGHRRPQRPE